jgi:hypothetical protein
LIIVAGIPASQTFSGGIADGMPNARGPFCGDDHGFRCRGCVSLDKHRNTTSSDLFSGPGQNTNFAASWMIR